MLNVVMGRSGSGKTSVVQELCNQFGYKAVKSYTTRPKRFKGEDGYIFVTDEEFSKLQDKVAPVQYNGYKYCSTMEQLQTADFYIAEPSAIADLEGRNIDFRIIFLYVDEKTAMERMQKRGDSEEKIRSRLASDRVIFGDTTIANSSVGFSMFGGGKIQYFSNSQGDVQHCVQAIHGFLEKRKGDI